MLLAPDTDPVGQLDGSAGRVAPLPRAEPIAALQKGSLPKTAAGRYVPVFRSAPRGGVGMAWVDGVIVWLAVDSAAGLAGLEQASRLLKIADAQTAKPLWFQEKATHKGRRTGRAIACGAASFRSCPCLPSDRATARADRNSR